MAIEIHIQIDLNREDNQIAAVINDTDTTLGDINIAIAELERAKIRLLDWEFEEED